MGGGRTSSRASPISTGSAPSISPGRRSPANISRSTDAALDALYDRQAGALDPAERLAAVRDFEARLLTEAYSVPLFWGRRIIPLAAEVQGYALAPNYFIGQDLAKLWLQGAAK